MKKTLFIIAILLALGLAGCSDPKDKKELKAPTIPPTETVAVGVRDRKAAPEAYVSTELYSDEDYTITRSGDAVFCKKDNKTSRFDLPASESFSDVGIITFSRQTLSRAVRIKR